MIRRRTFTIMIQAVIWVYAAFMLAWLLGRWVWGDQLWVLAVLNSFVPLLFAPLPAVLFLAVVARRRVAWEGALLPAVLWLILFGGRFLPQMPHAEGGASELRVMAFNVLVTNTNADAIASAIAEEQPDLIAVAELSTTMQASLDQRLGAAYPHRTLHPLPGANFGAAIYSRWPLTDLGSLKTGLGLRSAAADVHTPDGTLRFVALHPRSTWLDRSSLDAAEASIEENFRGREAQLAAVCRYLDEWGERPVIVAGDFNASEFHDAYRCVADRLRDTFREVGWGYGNTWPAGQTKHIRTKWLQVISSLTRIDYVFHSQHWDAVDAKVLKMATGSDHRPVVVTLSWANDE